MNRIGVDCSNSSGGWACRVTVAEGDGSLEFQVAVSPSELARYAPGASDPADLVRRSFEFLLAREPKESILRSFSLSVIARYFPEYPREIQG